MTGPSSSLTALGAPARATPLISVRSLSKSFSGPGGRPLPVLDDINLDVAEGEFVALLGRSGSGKSTLLRCVAGLMAPTEGEVLFRGQRLTGTNRETSMVFQTFALMPWLTVQQNVELGLEARGVPTDERAERALRAIDIVGLDGYETAYPKELSGGMRQRVGFARALVVEPAALLMDEPFSALDVLTSENLRGELLELWEGHKFPTKTIVMVTHNIEEAVLLADRILVLGTNPGRIRSDMPNPLPRPRRRRTPDFDDLVDQIYRMMTRRPPADERPAAKPAGTVSDTPLPQATVDGLSGLAEIMLARHSGAADLADLADSLGLEVDDLLPLVDALVLLGFAELRDDRLELTPNGRVFAGASIQDSKEIFARASLEHAPLVRTIYRSLRGSMDDALPAGFFTDILRTSFGEEEAARQLDVAVNWGRYAELYDYDATRGLIMREEQGIGATIAEAPAPVSRGTLTTYLGAAQGAGTTYTMLREGRALRAQGEDVVIGFADIQGRPHTAEAVDGLETVPLADGQLDLPAVVARKPAVALVDDLGRHAASIEALRSAGIQVISTTDVADVRRVAADVEAVTGRPAPGRVTDDVLAGIDALQFVDSSPEALRKRLRHGNIYPPDQIEAALATEFQPARLAALREIGLRLVADSVSGPAEPRQRGAQDVLVATWRPEQVETLVQQGVRLARRTGARCCVLAVGQQRPEVLAEQVEAAAAAAGASVMIRESRDAVASIISAVQELNARHLVLAVPSAGVIERLRGTVLERLAAQLPLVHLHIQAAPGPQAPPAAATGASGAQPRRRGAIRVYLGYAPGCGTTTAERRFVAARRLADAGITVVGTVQLGKLGGAADGGSAVFLDETALFALADEIELVDVAPSILRDRVRRGMIVPHDQIETALQSTFAADLLRAERERAFLIVAEHGERRLAAYSGDAGQAGVVPADVGELAGPDRQPSILACAAPWPGMEPLIRRSAALAAQVDGLLRVAVVRLGWPEEDELMAGYAAMTEQLGGEFVKLSGPTAALALAQYAGERQVTELVLSRTLPAGRYPVLRELVRLVHDAEVHVLPAEPG